MVNICKSLTFFLNVDWCHKICTSPSHEIWVILICLPFRRIFITQGFTSTRLLASWCLGSSVGCLLLWSSLDSVGGQRITKELPSMSQRFTFIKQSTLLWRGLWRTHRYWWRFLLRTEASWPGKQQRSCVYVVEMGLHSFKYSTCKSFTTTPVHLISFTRHIPSKQQPCQLHWSKSKCTSQHTRQWARVNLQTKTLTQLFFTGNDMILLM